MAMSEDKQWASKYLLDPLTAPEPSDETGPGTSFGNSLQQSRNPSTTPAGSDKNKTNISTRSVSADKSSPGTPKPSKAADGRTAYRREAFASDFPSKPRNRSAEPKSADEATLVDSTRRRRGSSLTSRFPGDQSHRPLDTLRREKKTADRSPHLRKMYTPGTDVVDRLDIGPFGPTYHHEGPFDAALRARNLSKKYSPLEALRHSNAEAIRATPPGYLKDSLEHHRPLDGVASVSPGAEDLSSGRRMIYQEGTDLMIEEGQYKRWPGLKYLPDDLKGKGEPSYSIEKALKDAKSHRRVFSDGDAAFELPNSPRPRSNSVFESRAENKGPLASYKEWEQDIRRSKSGAGPMPRKRLSLRRKNDQ